MNIIKCLLVAAAIIVTSTFVSAEEIFSGSVISVSGNSITIKSAVGEKTLSLSPNTQVLGNAQSIAEVVVGTEVAIRGNAEGTAALLIRVLPPAPPEPPLDAVVVGIVVSISETSLTLNTGQGDETFVVTPDTRKVNWTVISEIKVGNTLGIRVSADRKNATLINAKP